VEFFIIERKPNAEGKRCVSPPPLSSENREGERTGELVVGPLLHSESFSVF